jgi:hypothetical protein
MAIYCKNLHVNEGTVDIKHIELTVKINMLNYYVKPEK